MKKPRQLRSSRLSLQTKLAQVVEQRDSYLEALENIADVLEEAGILDPAEDEVVDSCVECGEVAGLIAKDGKPYCEDHIPAEEIIIPGIAEKVE